MIGYFIKSGDINVSECFRPYDIDFAKIVKEFIAKKDYGSDLKLLLIEYHLEGKFLELLQKPYEVRPYRKNEKSISVRVGVSKDFANLSYVDKKKFIVNTTQEAIRLVSEKMKKLGYIGVDFKQLASDVEECSRIYLETNGSNSTITD